MLGSARRERDEKAAVLVVGREDVGRHLLDLPGARAKQELLTEAPDAPLERERDRALALLVAVEPECLHDVLPHQLALAVAGQLEDAAAGGDEAAGVVARDEARVRRRVVVVEQLEQEPEAAALARDCLAQQTLPPVVVERAVLAVRADEIRHDGQRTDET